jgi:hypothetical protein
VLGLCWQKAGHGLCVNQHSGNNTFTKHNTAELPKTVENEFRNAENIYNLERSSFNFCIVSGLLI